MANSKLGLMSEEVQKLPEHLDYRLEKPSRKFREPYHNSENQNVNILDL